MKMRKSKDTVTDYVMQDFLPKEKVEEAAVESVKNKSGAGIGEKSLHKQLKKKLAETGSPLVKEKLIEDPGLEREEEEFYTSEDTGIVKEEPKTTQQKFQALGNQEQGKVSKGFKDALTHFGPRLASLLVGGDMALEGYESGMESFQAAQQPQGEPQDFQQVEELRDKEGNPISFSKQTGKFYNTKGKEVSAFSDPKMAQIKEEKKTDLAKARSDFKTKIVKEFNSTVKESQKALNMAKSALTLIESDSKLAMPVAARAVARLAGEGSRMTDKDVEQFMGSQAVPDSLKRVYQRSIDGTMTAEDKKVMTDAINKMQEVEMSLLTQTRDDMADRYGSIDKTLATKDELVELLSISEGPSKPKPGPSREQLLQKLPSGARLLQNSKGEFAIKYADGSIKRIK